MQPLRAFLGLNLKQWMSTKGFAMVVAVAFIPFALTGLWVATHTADVQVTSLAWAPDDAVEGDTVNFTAAFANAGDGTVRPFNATVVVGRLSGTSLIPDAENTSLVDDLGPGGSVERTLSWTARPGVYLVLARADTTDDVGEKDEFNNDEYHAVVVKYKEPSADETPSAPENLTGNETAPAATDAALTGITWTPETPAEGDPVTFTAIVENNGAARLDNATVVVEHGRAQFGQFFPLGTERQTVTLEPGENATVNLAWQAQGGAFWVRAYVRPGDANHDANSDNNHAAESIVVQPQAPGELTPPDLPEKLTYQNFFLEFLSRLHLQVLLPFLALFYAGGVLADERNRGNLTHLLTRPVGRWFIPVAKFVAGFALAGATVTVGLVASFLLLFGAGSGVDVGVLTTPILVSWLTLFAYGAFFVFLGVTVSHPYIVGIAFVLGWERLAGVLAPWVERLTLTHYLAQAITTWPLDQGLAWVPGEEAGVRALLILLGAGVAFLVTAAVALERREFEG